MLLSVVLALESILKRRACFCGKNIIVGSAFRCTIRKMMHCANETCGLVCTQWRVARGCILQLCVMRISTEIWFSLKIYSTEFKKLFAFTKSINSPPRGTLPIIRKIYKENFCSPKYRHYS